MVEVEDVAQVVARVVDQDTDGVLPLVTTETITIEGENETVQKRRMRYLHDPKMTMTAVVTRVERYRRHPNPLPGRA